MTYTYTYTGLELFMEKLKQLINSNYNPLINNHLSLSILSERTQFQLLYQELHSIIQTLVIINDQNQELQQVSNLKKRFKDAAEDAHDIVDLFVYNINLRNRISLDQVSVNQQPPPSKPKTNKEGWFSFSRHKSTTKSIEEEKITFNDVMRSIKSIKEEFITIHDKLKMDSSPRSHHMKTNAAVGPSCARNPLGTKKVYEEIVVGFDRHAEVIRDKLVEDQKQLDVVSIVGMGGLGKTTLANKVYNDPFVIYHFHVRGWLTVSQRYEKRDLLIQVLESIGDKIDNVRDHNYSQLRQMLHQKLMGKRYLIVIDDIWSFEAWDDLKLSFPNNHTGSRILLTSRLKEVASHAKSHGFIHQLQYLSNEESWELLRKKVFQGNDCPEWLIEPAMQIASNCHGLPLTLVVVAGVLANEATNKDAWERIGRNVSSYVVKDQTGYIENLALSFDHLPSHLRDCFLYLGGFPEDHKFKAQQLIWLWVAEGFIQEDEQGSMEEIAENYLMELVDRNLVVVADRKSNGGIKAFYVHDILRELCLEIATKENFCLKPQRTMHSINTYKQRRIFIEHNVIIKNAPRIRSLLCVYDLGYRNLFSNWSHFWMLLMVLDLRGWLLNSLPGDISLLIHLRYLALTYFGDFPSSICNVWSLQTLILINDHDGFWKLPNTISNLVNLRHLKCDGRPILFPAIQKPMNLQTISDVVQGDGAQRWVKCFPGIKKLSCFNRPYMDCDMESLTFLEKLKLSLSPHVRRNKKFITFPASLKSLTLGSCNLPWRYMSIIQSLPNLEVLKLLCDSFVGPWWDVGEEQFLRLKFLKMSALGIEQLEASSINFPCLKQLVLDRCHFLEEIPLEIGYIPTLELISISGCKYSVVDSVNTIQEEQQAQGNYELKIHVYNRRQ